MTAFVSLIADAAQEGRKVVLAMLATGGVFVGIIALGQITSWLGHKRDKH